ncbi:SDR family oxidoreductase [Shimia sagamensis]|uniref:NADP-dependent 3-hydroxy acid dehydrogenase YdfG n=1 Tax=Shimia sagamensis TaxID=1566352 RepID=A0ABY1NZ92_9RHOB|nr:SDR family NAD(P)-dependent oxidoreductase [Shimia sagamensis]SMP22575.1 NADP-dependent 3-hydroxy acid dehydrogenase YdfG [Shimia sagamensis]
MTNLTGKTAIITGASRGIGATTARHLAAQGANVVLAARSENTVAHLAQELRDNGLSALALPCDVADATAVQHLITTAADNFGSLDVLVNNAGLIDPITTLADSDPAAWSKVIDVNVKGVYHGLRYALPIMRTQGAGTIINISSGAANSFLEGWSHYCASKAALVRLTGIAHKENAEAGVTVVGLSPGTVATDMMATIKASGINPVSQLPPDTHIPAEWVAQAIAYLCGPEGKTYAGQDFSLKTNEGRAVLGLPPV